MYSFILWFKTCNLHLCIFNKKRTRMDIKDLNEKKEKELRKRVLSSLMRDERLKNSDIHVKVKGANVSLEGKVDSVSKMRAAEANSYKVAGVRTVENYLHIEPQPDDPQPSDSEIVESIRATLAWNNQIDSTAIEISVDSGVAELRGSVYSYHEMKLAEDMVISIGGVKDVINNIVVNTRYSPDDEIIADQVFEALDNDPMVNPDDINISLDNGIVTLSGTVQEYAAANAAHDALLYIPGVKGVINNINIG